MAKTKLGWSDIFKIMYRDKSGRWYPNEGTPGYLYLWKVNKVRPPSQANPRSYARALMTLEFSNWLLKNHPDDALELGLSTGQ